MSEAEWDFAAGPRLAEPSSRQYYVWQFAMWAIILHALLLLILLILLMGRLEPPGLLGLVIMILLSSPAIIGCHKLSESSRGWLWLWAYWLILLAPLATMMYLCVRGLEPNAPYAHLLRNLAVTLVGSGLVFFPLPVTLLAALLTIGTGRQRSCAEGAA